MCFFCSEVMCIYLFFCSQVMCVYLFCIHQLMIHRVGNYLKKGGIPHKMLGKLFDYSCIMLSIWVILPCLYGTEKRYLTSRTWYQWSSIQNLNIFIYSSMNINCQSKGLFIFCTSSCKCQYRYLNRYAD